MDRNSIDWQGYIPAITTPFTEQGALDDIAAKDLHAWLYKQGVHGLILLGTQGEWFSLNNDEKKRLLDLTGQQLSGKIPLIAGCSAFNAADAIENIEVAKNASFNGILLTPPPYMVPSEHEIYTYYKEVNDACTLPICVYNWPPGTNIDMSLDLLSKLAKLDKVVAIKNSTPNVSHFLDVFFALRKEVRIFGIPMNEFGIGLIQQYGADGTMGAGAVLGSDHPNFYNAVWDGDIERAKCLGERDCILMRSWFNPDYTSKFGSSQAVFKTALNLQGIPGGYTRRPILPLNEADTTKVKATLVELGNLQA